MLLEFVTWPPDAIPDTAANVCVYGDIPSLEGLNSINGKIVNNRSIVIRTIPDVNIAKNDRLACQILYMGAASKPSLDLLYKS